jgi:hypothetical protein
LTTGGDSRQFFFNRFMQPTLVQQRWRAIFCTNINPILCKQYAQYANQLLIKFVRDSITLFGKKFVVYNVHNLVHPWYISGWYVHALEYSHKAWSQVALVYGVPPSGFSPELCLNTFFFYVLPKENQLGFCKKNVKKLAFFTESRYSINFTLKI